jgi:hypothetical protein
MVRNTIIQLALVPMLLLLNVLTLEDINDILYFNVGNQLLTYAT